jgi:dTMP kinase
MKENQIKKEKRLSLNKKPVSHHKKGAGFIVLEGIDGSGKSTQAKLLTKALEKEGYKIYFIDFPQHGQKSAGLVDEYLTGKYGKKAREVSPYQASIFYACDRYDASFKIRDLLKKGFIVIADRYIGSNVGHQGGKIKNLKERRKYLRWLYDLEYGIFKIPKPDINFILKIKPKIAQNLSKKIFDKEKLVKKKSYLGHKKDIHEKDLNHLEDAEKAYLFVAKEFPKDFKVIECFKNNKLLSLETIHQKILEITKEIL